MCVGACAACSGSAGLPLAVRFDWSGLFLGMGGAEGALLGVKQDWAPLFELPGALGGKVRARARARA
jgi:hypothetical protein